MSTEFEADAEDDLSSAPAWMRVLGTTFDVMAACGTLLILAVMLLIVGDILGRNLAGKPVAGVAEIASRSVVAIVFLMLPAAALRGTLIRADFLLRMMRRRAPAVLHLLEIAFALIAAVIFAVVAWSAWPDTAAAWRTEEFFGVRGVWTLPAFPYRLVNVIGAVGAAIGFAAVALRRARQPLERL